MFRQFVVLAFVWIAACTLMLAQEPAAKTQDTVHVAGRALVTITDQQNGKEVTLPQGAVLVVDLESNPTTGYSWSVQGDPAPLELLKSVSRKSPTSSNMPGAPGSQEFRFKSSSAGSTTLTLVYRRPWEHDAAPAKTFTVNVHIP